MRSKTKFIAYESVQVQLDALKPERTLVTVLLRDGKTVRATVSDMDLVNSDFSGLILTAV